MSSMRTALLRWPTPGVLVTLAAGLLMGARAGHLRIGDQLPRLELGELGGGTLRLSELHGAASVVVFYSPFCEPCHRMLPVLVDVVEEVARREKASIPVFVIAVDGEPEHDVVGRYGRAVHGLVGGSGDAEDRFDPQVRPCTYVVDRAGVIRHINRGFGEGYRARMATWLRDILAGT